MSSSWSQTKIHIQNLFDPGMNLTFDHDFVLRSGRRKDNKIIWRYTPLHFWDWNIYHIQRLLEDYKNRPLKDIFEPFDRDVVNLADVLRACDRRIGFKKLIYWSFFLDGPDNPARNAMRIRFNA